MIPPIESLFGPLACFAMAIGLLVAVVAGLVR